MAAATLHIKAVVIFLLFIVSIPHSLLAQELHFNGYVISEDGVRDRKTGRRVGGEVSAFQGRTWVLAAEDPVSESWKRGLRDHGLFLEGFIPQRGYLVAFDRQVNRSELEGLPGVSFGVPLLPEMKIDRSFAIASEQEEVRLIVHLFRNAPMDTVLARAGGDSLDVVSSVSSGEKQRIGVRCSSENLQAVVRTIAGWDEVYYVQRDRGVRLANDSAGRILQSGSHLGPRAVWDRGIYGAGQVIAVCDTGLDADSCYFRDSSGTLPPANVAGATVVEATRRKVIAVDFLYSAEDPEDPLDWDTQGHGTGVAGSACGSQISDPTSGSVSNGMAPLAQLVAQDGGYAVDNCSDLPALGCPLIDLTPVFQQAYDQGGRLHNNSWGDRENFFPHNTYTAACADVDAFTWQHKDFLAVFAGGNDGAVEGAVDSPGVAKNAISVGGTGNGAGADGIIGFSSRGPASDGRIKPDLVAPASLTSADSDEDVGTDNCGFRAAAGTSFSSPLVTGAAALVRDYLVQGFYPSGGPNSADALVDPSAALVKAILLSSCVDVVNASDIPAPDQGWGRVNLEQALLFSGDSGRLFLVDQRDGFASALDPPLEFELSVGSSLSFKVVLVWSDYPTTPGAETHLVNDLDLKLTGAGATYWGNSFSGGFSVPGGSPDRVNNVEQIWVEEPVAGMYELQVIPYQVPEPEQDFALVITGDFAVVGSTSAGLWRVY